MKTIKENVNSLKYTYFIVTVDKGNHYPVLMSSNGKIAGNEVVKRAKSLENHINNLLDSCRTGSIRVVKITEKEFRELYPKFAGNYGPNKTKTTKKTK